MANKIFDRVGGRKPRMSAFDLSREQKLSCKMGELVPIYLEEIVPGDQFNVRSECMMRLAPMLAPVMHRVNVYMHYFFVPNRIIWNEWEDFITGGREGTSNPIYPVVPMGGSHSESRLADYLGIPTVSGSAGNINISQLPFRAYQLIYNDYYRDETLNTTVWDPSVNPLTGLADIRNRSWEKDYFTSSLPFAQRGDSVSVPTTLRDPAIVTSTDGTFNLGDNVEIGTDGSGNQTLRVDTSATPAGDRELIIDAVEGIDINDLRLSSALQRFLEKQARGGYRYIETILSHFGVKSSDARLQRPEYLGGGRQPIVISEVLNTTGTAEAPQGDMTGHGISTGVTNSFNKRFEEHGYVIGIMSVLPRTNYQQGIHRHWNRFEKEDYYWPEFAHLGEQEVKNKEIYFDLADETYSEGTFGYQQRYAEMKYGCSTVHGDFRDSLDFWHMGRIFSSQPSLNADFVMADPTNRIFAVTSGDPDHLWVQLYHNVKARRPMPYFADPRLT